MADKLVSMRQAGRVSAQIFSHLSNLIKPGVNLLAIEDFVGKQIAKERMEPAFWQYRGYPAVTCLSVNDSVVHSIPRDYILKSGDIVTVDFGIRHNGWIIDTAKTYLIGQVSDELKRLCEASKDALDQAIELCRVGEFVSRIGEEIERLVKARGFYVIKEFSGHGVGRSLWESPTIYNYANKRNQVRLKEGVTIAIEPIVALRPVKLVTDVDGWTIKTLPPTPTAHFEHSIYIDQTGPIVLTK